MSHIRMCLFYYNFSSNKINVNQLKIICRSMRHLIITSHFLILLKLKYAYIISTPIFFSIVKWNFIYSRKRSLYCFILTKSNDFNYLYISQIYKHMTRSLSFIKKIAQHITNYPNVYGMYDKEIRAIFVLMDSAEAPQTNKNKKTK